MKIPLRALRGYYFMRIMATDLKIPARPARILPVGIQDFPKLRKNGYIYVDKTPQIYPLITGVAGTFFLSRPRRFGKSLLSSTFGAIFEGRRELFGEIAGRPALAIDGLDWEWKWHPVIRIDLGSGNYGVGVKKLQSNLCHELRREARKYGITLNREDSPDDQLKDTIEIACEKIGEKAVVLIDEYDSPLTNTLNQRDVHIELRNALKEFYGVIKSYDAYLRFIFITGVSKFSQVSIFSGLNQLTDLTFDPQYADICGLTQEELEANFVPEIERVIERTGRNRKEYLDELRLYYNGYRFSKAPLTVYNPLGLLRHFKSGEFSEYWYENAMPSFLEELINKRKINIQGLGDIQMRAADFSNYDIDNILPAPLLYQTGYLTISDYDDEAGIYTLDFINNEARAFFTKSQSERSKMNRAEILDAFDTGDIDGVMNAVMQNLAEIPYEATDGSKEYLLLMIYTMSSMLGFKCLTNVHILAVGIDLVVKTQRIVYCFQATLDGSAEEALAHINRKECVVPWAGHNTKVIKAGVNFDSKKRNIGKWVSATA